METLRGLVRLLGTSGACEWLVFFSGLVAYVSLVGHVRGIFVCVSKTCESSMGTIYIY